MLGWTLKRSVGEFMGEIGWLNYCVIIFKIKSIAT